MTIDHIASDQYLCDQYLAVIDCLIVIIHDS